MASQRTIVDRTVREHCGIRGWEVRALNVRTNHVHLVVTADVRPAQVMSQLKAWCSRRLSEHLGLKGDRTKNGLKDWWSEHGSTIWINDESHFNNAIKYVVDGQ